MKRSGNSRQLLRFLLGLLTFMTVAVTTVPANADSNLLPQDTAAVGTLGFCDSHDKPVTSGNVRDVPFVHKYVSDQAPPTEVAGKGRNGVIWAFVPLPNLVPEDWPSRRLTFASVYENPKVPMAKATFKDPGLMSVLTYVPPKLDGLIQLRMYLDAPGQPAYLATYPTAVVRVSGDTWKLVQGNFHPACSAGKVVSLEETLLPAGSIPTAPPSGAANAPAPVPTGAGSKSPSPIASSGANGGSSPSASTADQSPSSAAQGIAATGGSSSPALFGVLVLLGVGLAALGAFVFRARRADGEAEGAPRHSA